MLINVFLPCKRKSQRVPNKNKRKFANVSFGLIKIKINQLLKAKQIDKIFLSTDDKKIIKFATSLNKPKIIVHERKKKNLSNANTQTQVLIDHACDLIKEGHILWTHVTSPIINEKIYDKIILKYKKCLKKKYDSLMTVTKLGGFIWDEKSPINYDNRRVKWPKTQTIKKLNKINSAVYLNSVENYKKYSDRIGKKPFMYELNPFYGLDIEGIDDFILGEYIFKNRKRIVPKH